MTFPLHRFGVLLACLALASLAVRAQDQPVPDAPPTKPVSHMIPLGDYGADDMAYLCIPTTPPTVGIILVPDAYGLDTFTKAEANRLAGLGYLVLAVDIYNGRQTTDAGDLVNLVANLNAASVMKTINAGIRFFKESPTFHVDHVVAMGWGAGANYVFSTAQEDKSLDGAVTFYGPLLPPGTEPRKFAAPMCAVYPQNDPLTTHENVIAFQRAMKASGNDFEAWFIAAGRGWSNPQSKSHNAIEDREAWKVAMPFIVRIGAAPVKSKNDSIIDKAKDSIEKIFK